ncbi:uncharacterized protein LY89DRAFT_672971 [Mollisia scopiformis]|uniref:Uncharacterized protein n=1 Tax=Mollisia scopiformis TaxID=149040 RepID=A0A194WY47_MOLSC|nr:uncharacterized protein LY89DRAFT_672971 [Mollisia scopiformis]KUJ12855.1 hypothetical protein LY89DRAFT_672971 [Mollisia scopiformis]
MTSHKNDRGNADLVIKKEDTKDKETGEPVVKQNRENTDAIVEKKKEKEVDGGREAKRAAEGTEASDSIKEYDEFSKEEGEEEKPSERVEDYYELVSSHSSDDFVWDYLNPPAEDFDEDEF